MRQRRAAALCALAIVSGAIAAAPARRRTDRGRSRRGRRGRRLRDLRRGRPLGRQHEQQPLARRRARPDRLLRQRGDTAETIPRLPPLQGRRDPHRRRRRVREPRLLRRAHLHAAVLARGSNFKPGLDFYDDGAGHIGQAKALQQYAATHNVKLVVVLIGANNFGFASVVQTLRDQLAHLADLVEELLLRRLERHAACSRAPTSREQRNRVTGAFANLKHGDDATPATRPAHYPLVAQTYSSPIPHGSGFRYPETGYTRQTIGGCGVWNRDADWANDTMVDDAQRRRRATAAAAHGLAGARRAERARRPPAVREHGRAARGDGDRATGRRRARPTSTEWVTPDPHGDDARPALPAPGGPAPELLGPAGAAQLRAPGLQRRCAAGGTCTQRRAA